MPPTGQAPKFIKRYDSSKPTTHQVVKIIASISAEDDCPDTGIAAREEALKWIARRAGELPDPAWAGKSFELDGAGTLATAIKLSNQDYWVAKLNDPDTQIPGRIWSTEITIAASEENYLLGLRLMVSTRDSDPGFTPSVPGIVRQLSNKMTLKQGHFKLCDSPWTVESDYELVELVNLIQSPDRQKPIFAISLESSSNDINGSVINAKELTKRTIGIAHVAVIPDRFTYHISHTIGKNYSVYNGAVRTYMPGFTIGETFPEAHPVALKNTILNWGPRGKHDFVDFLIQKAANNSINRLSESDLPRLSTLRTIQRQHEIKQATTNLNDNSDSEQIARYKCEVDGLTQDCKTWEDIAKESEREKIQAIDVASEAQAEQGRLRARIIILEDRVKKLSGKDINAGLSIPESLDDLNEWANMHLAGRVILTKRALRSVKNTPYNNIELLYKSLLILGNDYIKMKNGELNKKNFDEILTKNGLSLRRCFSNGEAGANIYGNEYYTTYNGQKKYLELHLKNKANTRDPARCLRIYFFWDAETSQVIIGYLPGHLPVEAS